VFHAFLAGGVSWYMKNLYWARSNHQKALVICLLCVCDA